MADDLAGLRVLIVDDQASLHTFLTAVLMASGVHHIESAHDGAEAFARLDALGEVPDVILCDLNMPGMDGPSFFRHLGERGLGADVILVSGEEPQILRTAEALARTHGLSVLGSLGKPIEPRALTHMLTNRAALRPHARASHTEQITVEELEWALRRKQLTLHYQPKVRVANRRFVGAEVLVRWQHEQHGLLSPDRFLPLAEKTGLIHDLTDVVLREALMQSAVWRRQGLPATLSINVSTQSLERVEFVEQVVEVGRATSTPPAAIILEVTETGLMENIAASLEVLTRLRIKGVGLSIDDFGTGYSSMQQLRRVPFTELKIDRSFVDGASKDRESRAILQSSVELAHELNLTVVAEGVENPADWDMLAELGVDLAQGYMVARPMPAEELPGWLESWTGKR